MAQAGKKLLVGEKGKKKVHDIEDFIAEISMLQVVEEPTHAKGEHDF